MKLVTLKSNFSGIKTIVFYQWDTYIPTNPEKITSRIKIDLAAIHSKSEVYYYSGEDSSEYLDFSEYNFKFNPEKDKFKSFIKSNYLDLTTLDRTKIDDNFDQTLLSTLSKNLLPQLSDTTKEKSSPKFFGVIVDQTQNILYLNIPEGIWKVELYEDYIKTNNSYSNSYDFLPYELLDSFYQEDILAVPNNIITFGAEVFHSNNIVKENSPIKDYSKYYRESLDYYIQDDFININESEWRALDNELHTDKLLKLIISPGGVSNKVLNLSQLSWIKSENPNRNQNRFSLRNDEFYSTRDYYKRDDLGEALCDTSSGTMLSTNRIKPEISLPLLETKLSNLKNRFSTRKVYKEGEMVLVNDYLYSSLVSGNIGENPIYSRSWKLIKRYQEGDELIYLGSFENSLSILREKLWGGFYQIYTHVNNKKFGTITPNGYLSYRQRSITEERPIITITPNPGYYLNYIDVYIDKCRVSGLAADYSTTGDHCYTFQFPADLEIKKLAEIKAFFAKQSNYIGLIKVLLSGIDHFGAFKMSRGTTKYYTEKGITTLDKLYSLTSTSDSTNGISLSFYTNLINEAGNLVNTRLSVNDEFRTGRDLIILPETVGINNPVRLEIDDFLSPYRVIAVKSIIDGVETLFDLSIDELTQIKYINFSENQSLDLSFVVESKKCNCKVIYGPLIDVSTEGAYVTHSSSFTVSFTRREDLRFVSSVKISYKNRINNSNTVMETTKIITFGENGIPQVEQGFNGTIILDQEKSIYTLTLDSVCFDTVINII